jgi:ribosomal protein L29
MRAQRLPYSSHAHENASGKLDERRTEYLNTRFSHAASEIAPILRQIKKGVCAIRTGQQHANNDCQQSYPSYRG